MLTCTNQDSQSGVQTQKIWRNKVYLVPTIPTHGPIIAV